MGHTHGLLCDTMEAMGLYVVQRSVQWSGEGGKRGGGGEGSLTARVELMGAGSGGSTQCDRTLWGEQGGQRGGGG
jgi:hypothetical protein